MAASQYKFKRMEPSMLKNNSYKRSKDDGKKNNQEKCNKYNKNTGDIYIYVQILTSKGIIKLSI